MAALLLVCQKEKKSLFNIILFINIYRQHSAGNKLKHLFLEYFDFFPSPGAPQKQQIKQMGRRGTGYKVDKAAFHGLVYSINVSFVL